MTKIQKKSLVFLIFVFFASGVVIYFGMRASAESQVYRSAFEIYENVEWAKNAVVLSKPNTCHINDPNSLNFKGMPKDVVNNFLKSNSQNSNPIYLQTLEGIAPIVSWDDTKRLYNAGYNWHPKDGPMLWVSRVGINKYLDRALLCIESIRSEELGSNGILILLDKNDGKWVISSISQAWIS